METDEVLGDSGYDGVGTYEYLSKKGIGVIIKPPNQEYVNNGKTDRDIAIKYMKEKRLSCMESKKQLWKR